MLQHVFPEYYEGLHGGIPWLTQQTINVTRASPDGTISHEKVWLREIPGGACLIITDQTKLRQLEASNAQTARLACLGFMLASATHEICNPLSAVYSMVQILQSKRGGSPAVLQQGLKNIANGVKRILAIAQKLNLFSRMDDEALVEAPVDVVMEEAIELLSYDSLGETVQVVHHPDSGGIALARKGQLQQVFVNILLNAAQAMKGQGKITVVTRRIVPYTIAVSIHDSGPGVPPEHLKSVLEPFFTTKSKGEGTGLGLAISNEIVCEHGGSIVVENDPEGGACFHVLLPLATKRRLAPIS